jgi:hypothetical protein
MGPEPVVEPAEQLLSLLGPLVGEVNELASELCCRILQREIPLNFQFEQSLVERELQA